MIPSGCIENCPGCRYRGLSLEESNARKQAWVSRWLSPLSGNVLPIASPAERWHYRRKALLHAQISEQGWQFGLLKRRGWETELIPIPDCPLHAPKLNQAFTALRALLPANLPLAFVQMSGEILTLVLKCRASAKWRDWGLTLKETLQSVGVESLQINWNPAAGRRAISSRHQELIFGPAFLRDGEFHYGALSFRQQIPAIESKALSLAEPFLASFGKATIVDLYSGSGTTLARWRMRGWKTAGVELGGEAVHAAELNAPGALLLRGKAEQRIPQLRSFISEESAGFVAFTNPPREGHHPAVNAWLLESRPLGIAYLSCNARSLARDLEQLAISYTPELAQPLDFFPQTDHVEVLTLLSLR